VAFAPLVSRRHGAVGRDWTLVDEERAQASSDVLGTVTLRAQRPCRPLV
jgi:hypothetical protein